MSRSASLEGKKFLDSVKVVALSLAEELRYLTDFGGTLDWAEPLISELSGSIVTLRGATDEYEARQPTRVYSDEEVRKAERSLDDSYARRAADSR